MKILLKSDRSYAQMKKGPVFMTCSVVCFAAKLVVIFAVMYVDTDVRNH